VNFKQEDELSDDFDEEVKSINMSYFVNKHAEDHSMRTSRMSVLGSSNASQNKFNVASLKTPGYGISSRSVRTSFAPY
jgi:hypothetical protein